MKKSSTLPLNVKHYGVFYVKKEQERTEKSLESEFHDWGSFILSLHNSLPLSFAFIPLLTPGLKILSSFSFPPFHLRRSFRFCRLTQFLAAALVGFTHTQFAVRTTLLKWLSLLLKRVLCTFAQKSQRTNARAIIIRCTRNHG